MALSHPTLLFASFFCVFSLIFHVSWRSYQEYRGRKTHGCGKIPAYPQWDRIFGLDLAISQLKALRGDYFIPWLAKMHEGMPKTFTVRFLGKRQIFTTETENLKSMTAINWQDFGISPLRRNTRAFHPFADKGVNTVDGEDWVFSRFLIKPFFNRDVYTSTERVKPFVDSFLTLLPPDGETFNIQPMLQLWFLDLTTDFIFGEPMGALTHPEKAKITWAMLDVLRGSRQRMQLVRIIKWINWDWWLKAVDEVHAFVDVHLKRAYKEIEERKALIAEGKNVGPERQDLCWYMASNDPDYEDLRSQLSLLLVPNNDTTSIFISNAIWHLARHPHAWARCRQEVLDHVKNYASEEEAVQNLSFSTLRSMKFLNACLDETLRLNPNNVTQVRVCVKDTTLPRGGGEDGQLPIFVRKGDMVQVTKTVQQRNPEYWGEDSDKFRPERFLDLKPFWEFVPFSGGPRRCPAQMMVMTEGAYMLARLVLQYSRVEARDANDYKAIMRIGPSNKTGVLVAFHK